MTITIKIDEHTYKRLQQFAIPLEDDADSLIRRLLDHFERSIPSETDSPHESDSLLHRSPRIQNDPNFNKLLYRTSRQRGIRVRIDDEEIKAESLSALYEKALKYMDDHGCLDELRPKLPWATSRQRYLLALEPIHPGDKSFVAPVKYKGYFMEAHKDYKTGLKHLRDLLKDCGSTLTIIE